MKNLTKVQQSQYDDILKRLNRPVNSEIQLQSKCADLLYLFYPNEWRRFVCVNNSDKRANSQNIGIVEGASDTYWIANEGRTIYIEFKFGSNKQSKNQQLWEALISRHGHTYRLCYTEDTFWAIIGHSKPIVSDILKLSWFNI